jgi:hypothetical protein
MIVRIRFPRSFGKFYCSFSPFEGLSATMHGSAGSVYGPVGSSHETKYTGPPGTRQMHGCKVTEDQKTSQIVAVFGLSKSSYAGLRLLSYFAMLSGMLTERICSPKLRLFHMYEVPVLAFTTNRKIASSIRLARWRRMVAYSVPVVDCNICHAAMNGEVL